MQADRFVIGVKKLMLGLIGTFIRLQESIVKAVADQLRIIFIAEQPICVPILLRREADRPWNQQIGLDCFEPRVCEIELS